MEKFDWHYIGQFGQLGPLSEAQMCELIRDEVISGDTFVWKSPMPTWAKVRDSAEFGSLVQKPQIPSIPPGPFTEPPIPHQTPTFSYGVDPAMTLVPYSDRNRVLAGILQIFLPFGVGRFYLGYIGTGIWQLILNPCFGIGTVWSIIDGILILTGSVQRDGMGRPLRQ